MNVQFPIGIDSHRFIRALDVPQVQDRINELKRTFTGRKVSPFYMMFIYFYILLVCILFGYRKSKTTNCFSPEACSCTNIKRGRDSSQTHLDS